VGLLGDEAEEAVELDEEAGDTTNVGDADEIVVVLLLLETLEVVTVVEDELVLLLTPPPRAGDP
jgi:hypothetical protein